MLLSFFLPTYWKNKLLLAQNVLSMGIRDGFLITCLASVSRTKTTILNISSVLLPEETAPHPTFEAQAECIKKALLAAGKYDHLVITESSENILFKELEFPFSTREQLDLVLYEELEPQLPFNPSEAFLQEILRFARHGHNSRHAIHQGWSLIKKKEWLWVEK